MSNISYPGTVTRQTQHPILQRQGYPTLRRSGHVRQILGACMHPSRRDHAGRQRGRPQHVGRRRSSHRMGLPPRSPEQSEPRQYPPGLHHLGSAVPHRS